jgi:hypothetical protein
VTLDLSEIQALLVRLDRKVLQEIVVALGLMERLE